MYSIRGDGDVIAQEFFNILGDSQTKIKKFAQEEEELGLSEDGALAETSYADDESLKGLLVDDVEAGDNVEDQISEMMDYLDDSKVALVRPAPLRKSTVTKNVSRNHKTADPTGQYIMNGLGKISASLRAKGEGFAADVVEATAFSIRGDLVKEAGRKSELHQSLDKLASEFGNNGDNFAADMVKATISKIRN